MGEQGDAASYRLEMRVFSNQLLVGAVVARTLTVSPSRARDQPCLFQLLLVGGRIDLEEPLTLLT